MMIGYDAPVGHAAHEIELDWSPTNGDQAMRATCRVCGDVAEAWCAGMDWRTIRAAENTARANLAETCCVPKHWADGETLPPYPFKYWTRNGDDIEVYE